MEVKLFMARGFPLLVSATLIAVLVLSNVPPTLFFLGTGPTQYLLVAYSAFLVALAVGIPSAHTHPLGAGMAFFVFGGRAGGFLELVFRDRPDLIPAVMERGLLVATMVMWHYTMAQHSALESALRDPVTEKAG